MIERSDLAKLKSIAERLSSRERRHVTQSELIRKALFQLFDDNENEKG